MLRKFRKALDPGAFVVFWEDALNFAGLKSAHLGFPNVFLLFIVEELGRSVLILVKFVETGRHLVPIADERRLLRDQGCLRLHARLILVTLSIGGVSVFLVVFGNFPLEFCNHPLNTVLDLIERLVAGGVRSERR